MLQKNVFLVQSKIAKHAQMLKIVMLVVKDIIYSKIAVKNALKIVNIANQKINVLNVLKDSFFSMTNVLINSHVKT